MVSVVIIGAGLSGLICAKRLLQLGNSAHHIHILEARDRFGGRMYQEGGVDLGATWSWPSHDSALMKEVRDLGVQLEPQHSEGIAIAHQSLSGSSRVQRAGSNLSPSGEGSTRFVNGAASIIDKLVEELESSNRVTFSLNTVVRAVTRISQAPLTYEVSTSPSASTVTCEHELGISQESVITASIIILALPPQLCSSITFSPPLPQDKLRAMQQTPTWMADTGKVAFIYNSPFWKEKGLSGTAFSRGGPMAQIWDASSRDDVKPIRHALSSFVFGDDLKYLDEESSILSSPIMDQLIDIFGKEAGVPERIVFKSWQSDPYTSHPTVNHENPNIDFGHPLVSKSVEGLIFSGTESAPYENGHMNGAVVAGERAAAEGIALLQKI